MNSTQVACERLTQSRDRLRQALSQGGSHSAGGVQVSLLAKTAYGLVTTVARNQPLALVVGTALTAALLVRTKAWRWLSMSALFAGLMPQLIKTLASQEKP
jgi:hypothetical protein